MPLNSESLIENVPAREGRPSVTYRFSGTSTFWWNSGRSAPTFQQPSGEGLRRANGRGKERNRVPLTAPLVRVAPLRGGLQTSHPPPGGRNEWLVRLRLGALRSTFSDQMDGFHIHSHFKYVRTITAHDEICAYDYKR